jgi:tRNA A-37 threonylcarbamoyl transferase component Bud32
MDTIRICRCCNAPIPAETQGSTCPECGCNFDAPGFADTGEAPLTPPTPAELGPLFPGLEILEVAGQGGMGTIYKARQPQLDRTVALKILSPELGRDPAFAQRFSREAQALAKLNHSNIVSIFDFGQAGGFFYFLMEYVDGVTLRALIDQRQIHAEESLRVVIEICHALQYAHEEGIVHLDIKPSNILFDKKGRVKIADFGLAQLIGKRGQGDGRQQPDHRGDGHSHVHGAGTSGAANEGGPAGGHLRPGGGALRNAHRANCRGNRFAPPSFKAGVDPRLDQDRVAGHGQGAAPALPERQRIPRGGGGGHRPLSQPARRYAPQIGPAEVALAAALRAGGRNGLAGGGHFHPAQGAPGPSRKPS